MKNREIIQAFAQHQPEKIVEMLDDMYCWGWNDGVSGHEVMDSLEKEWLDEEYNKDLWRESDVNKVSSKPTVKTRWTMHYYQCACGNYINKNQKYCEKCGCLQDWSEDERVGSNE